MADRRIAIGAHPRRLDDLAAVFGISKRTAIRYANAARAFLETPLEQ
ncbi:hypothetical protein ACWGI8_33090 [Streptomyces sp. NPDC054841]